MIIDGKKIAQAIIAELKKKSKPDKFLGIFLVGEDPASVSFIKQKERVAKELGVDFRLYKFPPTIKQDELRKEVLKTAQHKNCGGVIVQLPLPEHVNHHYVCNVIPREKDLDVLGERALGAFYAGRNPVLPPAVSVVKTIIENCKLKIKNSQVAVIGRGFLVGRPVAAWLMDKVAELHIYASQTENLNKKLKSFDLIVSGAGQGRLFSAADVEADTVIIDFGYPGDFTPPREPSEINYTPAPGGTGPILVAKLFENFYKLAAGGRL